MGLMWLPLWKAQMAELMLGLMKVIYRISVRADIVVPYVVFIGVVFHA